MVADSGGLNLKLMKSGISFPAFLISRSLRGKFFSGASNLTENHPLIDLSLSG
jgi:hypothetical protein